MRYAAVDTEAGIIQQQYENGLAYQKQMGFTTDWVEYVNFKEGRQWKPATEKTKNMPRPMFNIIGFILKHKIANVMNENIKMVFSPVENVDETDIAAEAADKFTRYSDTVWEEIKQDELNAYCLDDAATLGTGVIHYYWDTEKTGGYTKKYVGEMAGEVIDPMNIFFGNPQQKEVQKQPWIIISTRDMVQNVKEEAKKNGVKLEKIEQIRADKDTTDEAYEAARHEMSDAEKVTVLTKYWKEQGKVYLMKVCSGVVVKPKTDTGFTLYPIAVMSWEERKKSIFGVSEVEGLMPNQKIINFIPAMMALNIQDNAWSKWIVKFDALRQPIRNVPGEVLRDVSNQPGDNIKPVNPPPMSEQAQRVWESVINFTRVFTGANEVATGEPFTKDLNASAIIALQNASKIPIEMIKKRFYRFIEDIGRIWEEFFKVKYNLPRMVKLKDDDGEEYTDEFLGEKYKDIPLQLKIDVGASSSFSESLSVTSLDRFLDAGYITFEDYLEFAPKNVVPFRDRLLKRIREQQEEQSQMRAFLQQLPPEVLQQIEQMPNPAEHIRMLMQMPPEQLQMYIQEMMNSAMPEM